MMVHGPNGVLNEKTTKIIHSGIDTKKFTGSLTTPIYYNSTIVFNSYKDF